MAGRRLYCRRRDSSAAKERAFLPFLRISTSRSKDTSARGSPEKSGSRRKCPLKCRRMRKIDDAEVLKADSSHALGTQARLRTARNDKMIQVSGGGWPLDQTSLEFLKRIERPAPFHAAAAQRDDHRAQHRVYKEYCAHGMQDEIIRRHI